MKSVFTKLALLAIIALSSISELVAQRIVMVQYRHVAEENIQEFLHRETTYWSEVAQHAVNESKLLEWHLWQKMGGWDLPNGSNFMFVNVFEKASDLDNMGSVWDPSAVFPKMRASDMETNSLSTVVHQMVFKGVDGVGDPGEVNFIRVNYAAASDIDEYLGLEQSVWKPFISGQIESGNTSQESWSVSELLVPNGASIPFNVVTVDGYKTMGEAVDPSSAYKSAPMFPNFDAISAVHKKDRIQVYGLVKATKPK